jgi:hypothetical protein
MLNAIDSNGRTVWIVSRFGRHRESDTLAGVEAFARMVVAA